MVTVCGVSRKAMIVLFTAFVIIGAAVAGAFTYAIWRNNHDMSQWRGEIENASRIDGAVVVDHGSRFGLQPGTNGAHCDREAWLVFRTDLTTQAIGEELTEALEGFEGEWWVTPVEPGSVRVDFWYRFDDPGLDFRCM